MKRRRMLALVVAGTLTVAVGVFVVLFLTTGYDADADAIAFIADPPEAVEITVHSRAIEVHLTTLPIRAEFVFYPGAKVDPLSYAPLAAEIAGYGIRVWIATMPSGLATLGARRFNKVLPLLDGSLPVLLGGHSLGGTVAARFLTRDPEVAAALVLLAAYSDRSSDLSHANLPVLAISGSNDLILDHEEFTDARSLYAEGARVYEISGANHSGFGNYGTQRGDGESSISRATQQAIAARLINDFVSGL